jgi:hypothetical protein
LSAEAFVLVALILKLSLELCEPSVGGGLINYEVAAAHPLALENTVRVWVGGPQ